MKTVIFNGGIPTEPDVAKLREAFGVPQEETVIRWEQFEAVLKLKKGSSRFNTVVGTWRRELDRSHNVHLRGVPGVGLEVMNPDVKAHHHGTKMSNCIRGIGRSVRVIERIDRKRLTDESRRTADHIVSCGNAIRLAAATSAKQLPPINPEADGKGKPETN